ncbi:hypothetical protein RHMOL_Rhmol02G0311300 [Rhododendron molle]|uniref:Uncharacterized protein n=1 Tax=Rhododendron molle TaxID=49168 RepID=A0ACC0PYX6_RHOML|nr:hypothetical protein RHMOL_Rhmol02G0311300 [Rhododendron molle]
MGIITSPKYQFLCALLFLLSLQTEVFGTQYQVGNLNCWGVPPAGYEYVYVNYSNYNTFNPGDSLFFLFPPSQDSVLLVTAEAYATCNTANPIWSSNTGNSVFNINTTGVYYFISGVPNNCRNNEKLQVCVPNNGTCATYTAPLPPLSPASAPAPAPSQLRSTSSAPSFSPSWSPPAWSPSFPPPLWSPKSSPSYSALSPMIRSWSSMISRPIVVVSATLGLLVWASVME